MDTGQESNLTIRVVDSKLTQRNEDFSIQLPKNSSHDRQPYSPHIG